MKVKIIYPPKNPEYRESFEIYNVLGEDLVTDEDADFIFYILDLRIYLTGEKPHLFPLRESLKKDASKIVIIDYSDPPEIEFIPSDIIEKVGWYFKRSVVKRGDDMMVYPHLPLSVEITPIYFAVRNDYLRYERSLPPVEEKCYDIACMFLEGQGGMRSKAVEVVKNRSEKVFHGVVYDKDFSKRYGIVNKEYYNIMRKSKIIVTANPKDWEGDFRLWEALLTGSMVMCDRMISNPGLTNRTHIIWYDNPEHLDVLLTYYLQKPEEIEEIGMNGKLWCLSNGLYKHRVQDILSKIGVSK